MANLFGQFLYGNGGGRYTDYAALKKALLGLHQVAKILGYSVSLPYRIGCGLAGGNWNVVRGIIEDVFSDEVVCEIWKLE